MNEANPTKGPTKYCFNCGAQIDANTKICPKCGIGSSDHVSIADDEKVIKKTSEEWSVILKGSIRSTRPITWDELEDHPNKNVDSMILTEKRIIIGDYSISLDDIVEIDLEPQFADISKIRITCNDRIENLQFHRGSLSHGVNILWGEIDFAYAEDQAYTAYWASVLTMAAFLYGRNYGKRKEVESESRKWCSNCKQYVAIPLTDKPVWKIYCPECGQKSILSSSPEDRKKQPH